MQILAYPRKLANLKTSQGVSPLPSSGIVTHACFTKISHWSEDDCFELLQYYWENESVHRKGWNNNMSLVTKGGETGDITWSLIYWKFELFTCGIPIIIPFTLQRDERGILRAETTLQSIRYKAIFCSPELQSVANGERRKIMVEGFGGRILDGFGWRGKKGAKKNKIRRYRLVALLNSPDIVLNPDIDVHHLNGVNKLRKGNKGLLVSDDRSFNLQLQHKTEHHKIHKSLDDYKFRDYRKTKEQLLETPKQLELDLDI